MQKKKGISLIVLVITIIVMIILAAAIILSLNNAGIINKANQAVQETDLAQVKHLATLAWSEAYLEEDLREAGAIKGYIETKLKDAKIDLNKYELNVTEKGVDVKLKDELAGSQTPNNDGKIPEGATYYVKATATTYTAGNEFPAEVKEGDVYTYNGYEYRYDIIGEYDNKSGEIYWHDGYDLMTGEFMYEHGWHVLLKDNTKVPQEEVLSSINGRNLVGMEATYAGCTSLTTLDDVTIPNSVKYMSYTFGGCTGLTTLEGLTIPNSVTNMFGTFYGCTGLTTVGNLVIPSSIEDMGSTFYGCTNLTGTIQINANPSDYTECLGGTKITQITGSTTMKEALLETKAEW